MTGPEAALKTDINVGLAYMAGGRVKDFDAMRIIESGKKLVAERSRTTRFKPNEEKPL